jgi:MazG family protein
MPQTPKPGPSKTAEEALERMSTLLDGLLHPDEGCPWDLKQTCRSISEDFLEETYELREALLAGGREEILEEAGDLLFLLFFFSRLALKGGLGFGLKEIIDAAVDKMVRRHPHVFASDEMPRDAEEVLGKWHAIKRREKKQGGLLDSVPLALPALARNHRLGSKASKAGFDWDSPLEAREKLSEELGELDREIEKGGFQDNQEALMGELGDVLAAASNLARLLGFSPEKALDAHNRRFVGRFNFMCQELERQGRLPEDASKDELEELWQKAKRR